MNLKDLIEMRDGTGPHGKGNGPGNGKADCSGLNYSVDTEKGGMRNKAKEKRDGTGPHGRGMGPGKGKADCSGMQADGATYKEYLAAMLNKFDKKSVLKLSPTERKELDAGWKAKDE